MNGKTAALLLSSILVACAQVQPPPATAPSAPSPPSATAPSAPSPPSASAPAAAAAPAQAGEPARVSHVVNIQRAGCRDLLRLAPDDRAAAAMFYIGYQASRLRASAIDVAVIPSIEAQAFVYCQENPDESVVRAFAEAYPRTRK